MRYKSTPFTKEGVDYEVIENTTLKIEKDDFAITVRANKIRAIKDESADPDGDMNILVQKKLKYKGDKPLAKGDFDEAVEEFVGLIDEVLA